MKFKCLEEFIKKQICNIVFTLCIGLVLILLRLVTLESNNFLFALEITYGFILLIFGIGVKLNEYLDLD